ncbi:type II restriction endonuclease [Labrenzia sp. CP4]|jgi:hypothetical protein|uniref:type II restriction endonuclease n=1 Tax=Labrenzia sp. CP4 TaxID=1674922 RepID=UPI0009EE3EAB|nr:type II restriction endonuclease [Labrenzia sp. CP4]
MLASPIEYLTDILKNTNEPLFCKVLSRNDHVWADRKSNEKGKGKQGGFYVPSEIRTSGFFPDQSAQLSRPHIFDTGVWTVWPQAADPTPKESNFVHYSNKGPEAHFTRLPKEVFSALGPSSLLVVSQPKNRRATKACWTAIVIPSGTSDYDDAFELLGLQPGFLYGLVSPPKTQPDEELAELILKALIDQQLPQFIQSSLLTSGKDFALETQSAYLKERGLDSFDVYGSLSNPGDEILGLCDAQYEKYKHFELRLRSAQLVQILDQARPTLRNQRDTVHAIVSSFPEILELFKSLRGARASRMGRAFELHIERVFQDSRIPYAAQAKIGNRKPDFLFPSLEAYKKDPRSTFILTAKSTLRERWQQILNEGTGLPIFLATLDRSITDQTISDMEVSGITIVAPEQFMRRGSKGTPSGVYKGKSAVISFRKFFDEIIPSAQKV